MYINGMHAHIHMNNIMCIHVHIDTYVHMHAHTYIHSYMVLLVIIKALALYI